MAGQFRATVLVTHVGEFVPAQQEQCRFAAFTAARTEKTKFLTGLGIVEGFGIKVGEDVPKQILQLVSTCRQPLTESSDLAATLFNQLHQGRLFRCFGKDLNQEATAGMDAGAVHLLTHKHG